jgi:hypothetical protein
MVTNITAIARVFTWVCVLSTLFVSEVSSFAQQSANVLAPNAQIEFQNLTVGQPSTAPVIARNVTSGPLTVNGAAVTVGGDRFTFTPAFTFPVKLSPNEEKQIGSVSVTITKPNEDIVGYLMVKHEPQVRAELGEVRLHAGVTVSSKIIASSTDIIPLNDTSRILGMTSSEYQFFREFTFKNTFANPVTITDASMLSGDAGIEVTSLGGADLPITLAPGEKITVRFAYSGGNSGMKSDRLKVETEGGTTFVYPIQAMRVTADNLRNGMNRTQLPLQIIPNPANNKITIQLGNGFKGDIQIFTADGKLVAERKSVQTWTLSPETDSIAAGEYVIKASATESGRILTRTEKLVLAQ